MKFINEFIKHIFPDYKVEKSSENFQEFKAIFKAQKCHISDQETLGAEYGFLQTRDTLHISITFGESDPVTLNSNSDDFDQFTNSLIKESTYLDGEEISIVVTISKTIKEACCTIYDFNTFVKTLANFEVIQFFKTFSKLFEFGQFIRFEVFDLKKSFHTHSLLFVPLQVSNIKQQTTTRKEIFEAFKSQCYFASIENFELVPSDFKLYEADTSYSILTQLFDRYRNLISVIYLFDITSIVGNDIEFKINGYKSIKGKEEIVKLNLNEYEEYYNIFDWVYNGGNLTDKIGLARNIISLHFKKSGELSLQGNPFQSVKSSFRVYEKQNIKQYIEIRNRISDQLIDFNNRANKIVETFASGFQKSTLALISFYISAIVIRVISKGEFVNIFSLDATILSIAFLMGSIIYYWVSRWEIKEQRSRFVSSYENLKNRYTDLLEPDDIKKILNKDNDFNQDLTFIDKKRKVYSRMWLTVVLLLAGSTIFLFLVYNLNQLSDTILFKLICGNVSNW